MPRRARQPKPEILGEILATIMRKRNIPHASTDRRLLQTWRQAVGPQIASQTHPASVKRGMLFVRVSAPVWMHQLQFMKEEILDRLRELCPPDEIRNLHFSIGEIPAAPSERARRAASDPDRTSVTGRDRAMMSRSLDAVRDPELRAILERVMEREITRRREREKRRVPGE